MIAHFYRSDYAVMSQINLHAASESEPRVAARVKSPLGELTQAGFISAEDVK